MESPRRHNGLKGRRKVTNAVGLRFVPGAQDVPTSDPGEFPAARADPRSRCDTWWPPRPSTWTSRARQRHLAGASEPPLGPCGGFGGLLVNLMRAEEIVQDP